MTRPNHTVLKHRYPSLYKRVIPEFSTALVKTYLVDGDLVRRLFKRDFIEGGHDRVYSWIPSREVWIENKFRSQPIMTARIALHELYERQLMKRMSYSRAHPRASVSEAHYTHGGEKLEKRIREVLERQ